MKPSLQHTLLACALAHAFPAFAQTEPAPIAEVIVTASKNVPRAAIGGFGEAALVDTPVSISTLDSRQMQDLSIHLSTEAMKYDAAVGDAYNAVGYAEQFSVRGFKLDNAYSYRKDGIAIPADAQIPLENKERIEVLKGLAGLQAGVAAPGGLVNYVTKRPTATPLRSVTAQLSERGTVLGTLDLGGRFEDRRFGYRINAAAERIRSYVRGADGERQFGAAAFDWQLSPDTLVQIDADYQHKSQLTVPGYQLTRNEVLPANVSPRTMLNNQPWAKPVDTDSANLGLRVETRLNDDWHASVTANKHWFKRDDFTAFPYGCSNEGDGYYPGYCSNGDYDVYDYQSTGERKTPWAVQAQLQGRFATGALRHAITLGAAYSERHDSFGDDVYEYVGSSNIYQNQVVPSAPANLRTGPVSERRTDEERDLFVQDVVTLSAQTTLHAGLRRVNIQRDQLPRTGAPWVHTDESFTLPSVALVYAFTPGWNVYGSLTHGLEHGGIAPKRTSNQFTALPASRARQAELGLKGALGEALSLSAAVFQIRKGLEYTDATNTFVRNGDVTHRGMELALQGKASATLNYGASLMALHTEQEGSGQASIDGKRATNVPSIKSSTWFDLAVPAVPGLKLNGEWQYAGRKAFDVENRVFVPGYHVVGLGAAYALKAGATAVTLRARVDNVFDKFYWRDVTPDLGGYLLPGAPRTFRLSAQFDF